MPSDAAAILEPERLRRLIEVGRGLLGELRVEAVLERVLQTARELTGAQYAAVGVLDEDRQQLSRFITAGIDEDARRTIGSLPHGRGVLGVLIKEPHPLRLHDVAAHPRSYGFPAGHPPMATFLGVPVRVRGRAWGNLYLTEKAGGGDFDEADEASVVVLADWAALAIENARLYEALDARNGELERAVRGFEATATIAEAVGGEADVDRVLELVVKRARALIEARSVLVLLVEGEELLVAAAAGQVGPAAERVPLAGTRMAEVLQERLPVRVADVAGDARLDAGALGVADAAAALLVPLTYRGRALGVLCAFDRLQEGVGFDEEDEQALRAFAASAATAVATARSIESDRVRAALESAEAERRRWARELHDETLQALGGLKVLLSGAARADDPERLRTAVEVAIGQVSGEVENLRAIITELRPASLDALGLVPALETLAQRVRAVEGLVVDAAVDLGGTRLPAELETTVYRVAQEALMNVTKHAGAHHVVLDVRREDGTVRLEVGDDGRGFDPDDPTPGFGLVGMRERVALAGGSLTVTPGEGGGTRVVATIPLPAA